MSILFLGRWIDDPHWLAHITCWVDQERWGLCRVPASYSNHPDEEVLVAFSRDDTSPGTPVPWDTVDFALWQVKQFRQDLSEHRPWGAPLSLPSRRR